jgi:hypothetical protein
MNQQATITQVVANRAITNVFSQSNWTSFFADFSEEELGELFTQISEKHASGEYLPNADDEEDWVAALLVEINAEANRIVQKVSLRAERVN